MLILWVLFVTTSAHKVYESTEDIGPEAFINVTTLYPITKNQTSNITNNDNITKDTNTVNNTDSSENTKDANKIDATVWKVEATYAESNLDKYENNTINVSDKKNDTKEFRPSPHLGTFYDDEVIRVTPTRASFGSFQPLRKPTSGFVSSIQEDHQFKLPKQILQTHKMYPYKFETPILTRLKDPWKSRGPELESKPTAEVPVRLPAGGLYKYQDPFQEKPGDEDIGLEFNDGKDSENPIKKRENPWERFLNLVTAFLPVGLIISALTPSIITIEDTAGTSGNTYPSNIYRRTSPGVPDVPDVLEPPRVTEPTPLAELPRISERCRRRLLCELHSNNNYNTVDKPERRRGKQCYKIRCDNTEALARSLKWLLEHRRYNNEHNYD